MTTATSFKNINMTKIIHLIPYLQLHNYKLSWFLIIQILGMDQRIYLSIQNNNTLNIKTPTKPDLHMIIYNPYVLLS